VEDVHRHVGGASGKGGVGHTHFITTGCRQLRGEGQRFRAFVLIVIADVAFAEKVR
jgi:hypothetical protein